MRTRVTTTWVILHLSVACGPLAAADDTETPVRAATVYDGHLLCLYPRGEVAVWDLEGGKYAKDVAARLSRKGLTHLAADGGRLWAAGDSVVLQWSALAGAWKQVAEFNDRDESLVRLVTVGGVPLLVFPSKVVDPVAKRTFKVPEIKRPFGGPPLRILATHGSESRLWIGTGNGEWGGILLGLDPKTGKWVQGDGAGYVTGITHETGDEVAVSWSMSHFSARTHLCIHTADGKAKTEYPVLEEKYYQLIAYSPHDKTLYGVEAKDVVTIKEGKPTKVATLDGTVFEREPNAIGVAPGLLALIPVGPKAVVVVPKQGEPWRLDQGKLTRLRKP
jgi:hypothetical protein